MVGQRCLCVQSGAGFSWTDYSSRGTRWNVLSFTSRRDSQYSGQLARMEEKVEPMSKVGVLMVEDNNDIRILLGTFLEEEG
jgi:hypothetical protein